jgi:hypothetical protein
MPGKGLTGLDGPVGVTKTDELFRREAKARKEAAASLEWLAAPSRR